MTEQSIKISIDTLKKINICGSCTTGPCNECNRYIAKNTAIEALKKQMSKKPKAIKYKSYNGYDCPNCGKVPISIGHNYCFNCGQKLDWNIKEGVPN